MVVAVQLQTHFDEASPMTAFHSAYRKLHSTKSALLNIQNDLLLNMAKGFVTATPYWISLPPSIPLTTPFSFPHLVKVGSTLSHPAVLQFGGVPGLCQILSVSLQTQSAQSFTLTVVLITTSTPMIPSYI